MLYDRINQVSLVVAMFGKAKSSSRQQIMRNAVYGILGVTVFVFIPEGARWMNGGAVAQISSPGLSPHDNTFVGILSPEMTSGSNNTIVRRSRQRQPMAIHNQTEPIGSYAHALSRCNCYRIACRHAGCPPALPFAVGQHIVSGPGGTGTDISVTGRAGETSPPIGDDVQVTACPGQDATGSPLRCSITGEGTGMKVTVGGDGPAVGSKVEPLSAWKPCNWSRNLLPGVDWPISTAPPSR